MPDYTRQLNEIVGLLQRQPVVPPWAIAIIGAIVGGLIGFLGSFAVSTINRKRDYRSLSDGLHAEMEMILSELRNHLNWLKQQSDQNSPSETLFSEFVKASLFTAVQSSPVFWNLETSRQLINAHRHLNYLTARKPSHIRGDVKAIELVLEGATESMRTTGTGH